MGRGGVAFRICADCSAADTSVTPRIVKMAVASQWENCPPRRKLNWMPNVERWCVLPEPSGAIWSCLAVRRVSDTRPMPCTEFKRQQNARGGSTPCLHSAVFWDVLRGSDVHALRAWKRT